SETGAVAQAMKPGRMIRTPKFDIEPGKIFIRLRGAGHIYAAVEGHLMIQGPLHGELVSSFKAGPDFRWHELDLSKFVGRRVHLQSTPSGPECAISKGRRAVAPPGEEDALAARAEAAEWDGVTRAVPLPQHAAKLRSRFAGALASLERGP